MIRVSSSSVVGMLTARYQTGLGRSHPRLRAHAGDPPRRRGARPSRRRDGPRRGARDRPEARRGDGRRRGRRRAARPAAAAAPTARTCASCASATTRRCGCCATRRRTCWPRPCSTSIPTAKIAIGPAIDDGFYYDFEFPDGPPGEADLERIEAEMRRILAAGPHPIERSADHARRGGRALPRRGRDATRSSSPRASPEDEEITEYTQDGFVDLCRGPHLQDTKPIRAFKLTSLAGAYWRGDSQQHDADAHLRHGLLQTRRSSTSTCSGSRRRAAATTAGSGAQLDLFHFSEVSPGSPFWHPKGMAIWNALTALLARAERAARLPRGAHADPLRLRAVEALGALGQLPREHVLQRGRRPRRSASSR